MVSGKLPLRKDISELKQELDLSLHLHKTEYHLVITKLNWAIRYVC